MARMLPPHPSSDVKSRAERRIFELLRDDPGTHDWTCLHSLALARHVSQRFGEIDFVVVAPNRGVFCLEVKGGRVSCYDGEWRFQDRFGSVSTRRKSPFLQARDGMFSLITAVAERFGGDHPLARITYGFGVLFPDICWEHEDPEHEPWQVYDRAYRLPISAWIQSLARETEIRRPSKPVLTPELASELVRFLRPDFECLVRLADQIRTTDDEILECTEEQFHVLDMLAGNHRILIEGAAGTGKTLLALEHARRLAASGKRVLLVCFNRVLGGWLRHQVATTTKGGMVQADSFHRFLDGALIAPSSLRNEFGRQRPDPSHLDEVRTFYREVYPVFALDALAEGVIEPFDALVVDEGQDLIRPEYLDVLDELVEGGLAGGVWACFCDFERQAIYAEGASGEAMKQMVELRGQHAVARLTVNCRNTRPIGEEASLLSGFPKTPCLPSRVDGLPVDYRFYRDARHQERVLQEILNKLLSGGIRPSDITILSPNRRENSCALRLPDRVLANIVDVSESGVPSSASAVTSSTVHAFKGMENAIVILTDIEHLLGEYNQSLLYVGMSRARQRLFVLVAAACQKEYQRLLVRKLNQSGVT